MKKPEAKGAENLTRGSVVEHIVGQSGVGQSNLIKLQVLLGIHFFYFTDLRLLQSYSEWYVPHSG